jgi:hypothetical protein
MDVDQALLVSGSSRVHRALLVSIGEYATQVCEDSGGAFHGAEDVGSARARHGRTKPKSRRICVRVPWVNHLDAASRCAKAKRGLKHAYFISGWILTSSWLLSLLGGLCVHS